MEILSPSEVAQVRIISRGRAENIKVYDALRALSVGHAVKLTKSDWLSKSTPSAAIAQVARKGETSYSLRTLADRKGWLITRTK